MRAILIPPNESPKAVEQDGLADLQRLVGGNIEGLSIGHETASAFGNEDAKHVNRQVCDSCGAAWDPQPDCPKCGGRSGSWVEGLAENPLATKLVYGDKVEARKREAEALAEYEKAGVTVIDATSGDPREPFIAGPIVIVGLSRNTGETRPVPEDVARALLGPVGDAGTPKQR